MHGGHCAHGRQEHARLRPVVSRSFCLVRPNLQLGGGFTHHAVTGDPVTSVGAARSSAKGRVEKAVVMPDLPRSHVRSLWLAIILLLSAGVAVAAGILAWMGGLNPPTAILTAGGAFSASTFLLLSLQQFISS